jgi:hypothetical protein
MYKRLILLLGMSLGSYAPTAAQTATPQNIPTQEQVAPIVTMVRTVPAPFLIPPFPLFESPGKSAAHFSHLFVLAFKRDQSLESLLPVREVRTLFLKQWSLPLVQLWGGRLRLDAFKSELNMRNVQLGPSGAGGLLDYRPQRLDYSGGPRSFGLYGVNLSFHFGRGARTGRSTQADGTPTYPHTR